MGAEQLEEGSFGDFGGKISGAFGAGGGGRRQDLEGAGARGLCRSRRECWCRAGGRAAGHSLALPVAPHLLFHKWYSIPFGPVPGRAPWGESHGLFWVGGPQGPGRERSCAH